MVDWLERCDWACRRSEFGELRVAHDRVVMHLFGGTDALWDAWEKLPPQRNVLRPCDRHAVYYAAIDFDPEPIFETRLATVGSKLTWVAEYLVMFVPPGQLDVFLDWLPYIDVSGDLRIAFGSSRKLVIPDGGTPQQRLAFAIGHNLSKLNALPAPKVREVIERCLDPDPARRFARLDELRAAFRFAGALVVPPPAARPKRPGYDLVEEALGWLAVGEVKNAHDRLRRAVEREPKLAAARELFEHADRQRVAQRLPVLHSWDDMASGALELERAGELDAALRRYSCVSPETAPPGALDSALARCRLAAGDFTGAIAAARRVLALDADNAQMASIVRKANVRLFRFTDVLEDTDAWLARSPADAEAHYTRGRALLGLGRALEARDAFERASKLDPKLLEAQLLFRETDRAVKRLRATVGAPNAMAIEVPDHLAAIREPIATGRIHDAIRLLREHEHDAAAQRLLGELLAFDGRHGDAVAAFDASLALADTPAAQLGRARSLLELDRADEALAIFARFDSSEALEGRARALQQLGRDVEAEAVLQCAVAAAEHGSELRVRTTRG